MTTTATSLTCASTSDAPSSHATSASHTRQHAVANRDELRAILDEVFAARPLDEWKRVLATARGAWAPVQTPEDIYADPQTEANGFVQRSDAADGLMLPIPPILFDGDGGEPPRAPEFAEHTDEILGELGIEDAERTRLKESGVVA